MANHIRRPAAAVLTLGALGIVFGDLGTSPLYVLQAIFGHGHAPINPVTVYGLISIVTWSVIIVVTVKYIGLLMGASNHGEGGIMALVALVRDPNHTHARRNLLILLGLAGISLFYGDSVITPAISVLSAVEGVSLNVPGLAIVVVPLTVAILLILFTIQRRGTGAIGRLFGPVMLLWFAVSAIGGVAQIVQHPGILQALSPWQAIHFFATHPLASFIAMGAVVLAITGAEALYADMGHFGRGPITRAWLFAVFPALILNYMGQGALITTQPDAIRSPYFLLFPAVVQWPVVILATAATLIASQSVIAGAFSLTRQAIHLGFAPRMHINHTSTEEIGQVYIGALNWLMCVIVVLLVLAFRSSSHLASAYGMAVSGTLAIDTLMFLCAMRLQRHWSWWRLGLIGVLLFPIDLLFVSSSLSKFIHGGWIPITIAVISCVVLATWAKGYRLMNLERQKLEGDLDDFVKLVHAKKDLPRIPGTAIYLAHHGNAAPMALKATLDDLHELHQNAIVVTVQTLSIPHVASKDRIALDELGNPADGISHITLYFGFKDIPNVPLALETARNNPLVEGDFDPYKASYFVSRSQTVITRNRNMARWRKVLFRLLSRNAASPADYYKLPLDHTLEMNAYLPL